MYILSRQEVRKSKLLLSKAGMLKDDDEDNDVSPTTEQWNRSTNWNFADPFPVWQESSYLNMPKLVYKMYVFSECVTLYMYTAHMY